MIAIADVARAEAFLRPVQSAIIGRAAGRRQGHGDCLAQAVLSGAAGDRAPRGLGGRPVALQAIRERREDGVVDPITPLDHLTAIRLPSRLLAALDLADPRRRAATVLADAFERVGSVKGGDLMGGDSKGGISDGGATTRVKHAARLRMIEAAVNGWPLDRCYGGVTQGVPRVALPVRRMRGARKEIRTFPALLAVVVDGCSLKDILAAHGWSEQATHDRALGAALLAALDDVALALWGGAQVAKRQS